MKWFVEITKIMTHGSFGELALSSNDVSQRQANVIAQSDCYFATLGKDDYQKILAKLEVLKNQKKVEFFKNMP
mgnify:FL=1